MKENREFFDSEMKRLREEAIALGIEPCTQEEDEYEESYKAWLFTLIER